MMCSSAESPGSNPSAGVLARYEAAFESDPDFIAETLALQITEEACRLMLESSMTRSSLASLMGVSRAYVTRILNAPPNLTLRSIAQLAVALGKRPRISLADPTRVGHGGLSKFVAADDENP